MMAAKLTREIGGKKFSLSGSLRYVTHYLFDEADIHVEHVSIYLMNASFQISRQIDHVRNSALNSSPIFYGRYQVGIET
jgi:hypothetical protein